MPRISKSERIIVADLEYTTFGDSLETAWALPGQHKEVVQIAAILFDLNEGEELKPFDTLVKPVINPILSDRFVDLTHITQKEVDDNGISFGQALKQFTDFCGDTPIWVFMSDWSVLEENCRLNKLPFPFRDKPFITVKPQLHKWGINPEKYSSGTLYRAVGLKMDGHVHNALHDVRSLAAALHHIHTH